MVEFKHLYYAANSTEAHLIKGLLENDGISTILFGEDLSIGVGELPVDVLQVEIKVDKKKHVKALEIISNGSFTGITTTKNSCSAGIEPSSPPSRTIIVTVPEESTPSIGIHVINPAESISIPSG